MNRRNDLIAKTFSDEISTPNRTLHPRNQGLVQWVIWGDYNHSSFPQAYQDIRHRKLTSGPHISHHRDFYTTFLGVEHYWPLPNNVLTLLTNYTSGYWEAYKIPHMILALPCWVIIKTSSYHSHRCRYVELGNVSWVVLILVYHDPALCPSLHVPISCYPTPCMVRYGVSIKWS